MRTFIAPPLAGTPQGQAAEHELRACVHCGFCNATCPTYLATGDELDGPRGRIYLLKAALEGEPVSRLTQHHLDRCLGCRACETTCPSGVSYHRLYEIGRAVVEAKVRRPWRERLVRVLIRKGVARPALFAPAVALGNLFAPLLPQALAAKVPALRLGRRARPSVAQPRVMGLLAGCAQSVTAGHFNDATIRVFDHVGIALSEAPRAGCCGALAAHLDAPDEARALARRNIDAWQGQLDAGAEAIIVNASGCAAFIKDYPVLLAQDPGYAEAARRVADRVRDPVEVLDGLDLKPVRAPAEPRIVVQEPCSLQHGLRLGGRIEALLRRLGFDPQPVADAHLCCGSAGAYALLQPDLAGRLRRDKVANLCAASPSAAYTANIGCWLHLRETAPVPIHHWIEAVDEVLG